MTRLSALLAVTVLASPVAAAAQPFQGFYLGAGAGGAFQSEVSVKPSPALGSPPLAATFSPGFVGVGSAGWGFGNGFRVEVEGSYRDNTVHKLSGTSLPTTAGGSQAIYGGMANVDFDLDVSLPWLFPYIGGGVGYQVLDWRNVHASGAGVPSFNMQGSPGDFAYQAIAGLSFPIPRMPGLSVTLEYRFLQVLGAGGYSGSVSSGGATRTGSLSIKPVTNNSVLLGVRYAFDVAPPPAPAAAATPAPPAAARSYLVFFDWDRAVLTDRARQVVAEAAANVPKVEHTRIEVNGYTDTSGSAKYNQALSLRRAEAVASELVRLGVAKNEIAIQGFGQTHLLVPTGEGVREPQNRRVEIAIK